MSNFQNFRELHRLDHMATSRYAVSSFQFNAVQALVDQMPTDASCHSTEQEHALVWRLFTGSICLALANI